ncbi:hypothetical protein [Nonomuraea maheshkhaliensis]|uniref:hypothetical protein n=1 Tax=Nonomuraea maheshkhaliensis TaxID=419590 RepID=UPI0031F9BB35
MIERADQLVLNYVSQAADAAHGVLRADQRLDFARRLRARIEVERGGSQNARQVAKVLARFGDPVALVEREARRLAEAGVATARDPVGVGVTRAGGGAGTSLGTAGGAAAGSAAGTGAVTRPASGPVSGPSGGGGTRPLPAVADEEAPPGVRAYRRIAQDSLDRRQGMGLPFAGLRRAAMSSANPMATGGRDARTIVKEHPRDTAALVILVLAALLVPFDLPAVAIFQVPLVVWAVGAAMVLFSDAWNVRDRFVGAGAPLLGYAVGGVLIGGLRVGIEAGMAAFVTQFWDVSGTMFMIGTGAGVLWLAYRLLDVS